MSALAGRLRAAIIAITAATLTAGILVPSAAAHPEPASLDAFMRALGQVESSGRYDAVNAVSGAYGKYQIMPSNWPAWASARAARTVRRAATSCPRRASTEPRLFRASAMPRPPILGLSRWR